LIKEVVIKLAKVKEKLIEKEKNRESKLIELLKKDTKLDADTKMEYLSIAHMFLEDFENNINCTSIEMHGKIDYISIDTWKDFLNYPPVRGYIKSFRDERISSVAEKGLMDGDKNAVNIKKAMVASGPTINNSNIVLIRLPEKVEFD
jgi:hypothetical protein